MQMLTLFEVKSIIERPTSPIDEENGWKILTIIHEGGEMDLHLHFKLSDPPIVSMRYDDITLV